MPDRSRRCLRCSLYHCMLCPVGEVFEGARTQSPPGICHRVLRVCCHRRKRKSNTRDPRSRTHPVAHPYPVESRHLALFLNASDRVYPFRSDNIPVLRSTNFHQGDRPVHDTPTSIRGWGHSNCTPPPKFTPQFTVTDHTRQQMYRMYHIYNRNPFICVVPSITTAASLGECILPLVFPVHLIHNSIAIP